MREPVQKVAAHYDRYPYPTVVRLGRPRPSGHTRGTLSYLLRRRKDEALRARSRVWVAGCGTQQGVHWALLWPEAEVIATDISDVQLATARSLAAQLRLTNVRFEQRDLLAEPPEGGFDFIVCTGVLHHTPDPELGLARLRSALRPGGALQLMVYSRAHRAPLQAFRAVVDSIAPPGSDADERYRVAVELLDAGLRSEACHLPERGVFEQLWESREKDRSFFADAVLHPLDRAYDIDELCAYLAGAGLRHVEWLHPERWAIGPYVGKFPVRERLEALSPVDRWRAVYTLTGAAGPLLEVLCEPLTAPERPAYCRDEIAAMPVACRGSTTAYQVQGGKVVASGELPAYEKRNGVIAGGGRGWGGSRQMWKVPDAAEPVLLACDGKRTVAEVIAMFEEDMGRDTLLSFFDTMLPGDLGMIAPAWE